MLTKINLLLLALLILGSIHGDEMWGNDKFAGQERVLVTKEEMGKEIDVKIGDIIQIELVGIGSTGYRWYIDDLAPQFLELISEETKKGSEGGKTGAPVLYVWQFKAGEVGQAKIKMDYYRKWEGLEKATDHFLVKINIHKKGR